MILKLSRFSLLLLLVACTPSNEKKYIDGDDLIPPTPPFWEYFTVEGFDVDEDGVRDDIELWINNEFNDLNIRRALKQYGKVLKAKDFVNDEETFHVLREESDKANQCIYFLNVFEYKDEFINYSLLTKFHNSWWRIGQSKKTTGKFLKPGSYEIATKDKLVGMKACAFEISNLEKFIEYYYKSGEYKRFSKDESSSKEFEEVYRSLHR